MEAQAGHGNARWGRAERKARDLRGATQRLRQVRAYEWHGRAGARVDHAPCDSAKQSAHTCMPTYTHTCIHTYIHVFHTYMFSYTEREKARVRGRDTNSISAHTEIYTCIFPSARTLTISAHTRAPGSLRRCQLYISQYPLCPCGGASSCCGVLSSKDWVYSPIKTHKFGESSCTVNLLGTGTRDR